MTATTEIPGLDAGQQRAYDNLRQRHEDKIRKAAEEIREYAGYILRDLDRKNAGKPRATIRFADDILQDAQVIWARIAALEAIVDVTEILESRETPGSPS
jgi:hypothetical protein